MLIEKCLKPVVNPFYLHRLAPTCDTERMHLSGRIMGTLEYTVASSEHRHSLFRRIPSTTTEDSMSDDEASTQLSLRQISVSV